MKKHKLQLLESAIDRVVNVGMCLVPYEDLSDIIDDKMIGFGTTKDELLRSFKDADELFKSQFEQMGDIKPIVNRERIETRFSTDLSTVFIVELMSMTLISEEIENIIHIRASAVFEFLEDKIKMIHWHASSPVDTENDHWHMEEWKREKEKLQQLVDQQTADLHVKNKELELKNRELKIETALERIRAKTMAMHSTSEIQQVIHVVHKELLQLEINIFGGSFIVINREIDQELRLWGSGGTADTSDEVHLPFFNKPFYTNLVQGIKSGPGFFTEEFSNQEKTEFFTFLFQQEPWSKLDPQEQKEIINSPGGYTRSCAVSANTSIIIINQSGRRFSSDENEILSRFGKVFEQTYTRFLDLQKAESQAREAKIEAALERIRSRSLAMHHSTELSAVVDTLLKEFTNLEFTLTFCIINLINEQDMSNTVWAANPETGKEPESYYMKFEDYPFHHAMWDAWKAQKKRFVYTIAGEEKRIYDQYLYNETEFSRFPQSVKDANMALERYVAGFTFFKYSGLQTVSLDPISEDELEILERFGRVFEQSYTRFLDLQKAEAQAKEAQIEAALEKVRSRSLAMHSTSELSEVVIVIVEKLKDLGVVLDANGVVLCTYFDDSKDVLHWIVSPDFKMAGSYLLPHFEHPIFSASWNSKISGEEYFSKAFSVEEKNSFFEYAFEHSDYRYFPEDFKEWVFQNDQHVLSFAWQKNSAILIPSHTGIVPTEDEKVILKRFARVFEQSYTRFLDLQKAEEQAREARIEVALERIRAQVTAMRQSDELFDIVVSMRKEFISLGHEADYFWHMKWTPEDYQMSMTSEDGNRVGMIITVPKFVHDQIDRLAAWEQSDSPTFTLDLDGPEAWDYIAKMNTYGKYEQADPHAPSEQDILAIGGLTFIIARTTHGEIGFSLPGKVPNPPIESIDTLARFAGVFDLAYRRFEDLLTSEKQTRKAKIELALERVRARAMAMQQPEELIEVAQVMREEMGLLGVEELETSSIYINKANSKEAECWYSIKDIRDGSKTYLADHFDLSYQDTWVGTQMLSFHQSEETKTSIVMKGNHRIEWINYCAGLSQKLEGYYGEEIPERTYHLTKFSNGAIGAATPGEISGESWDLLQRAALVFSLAYSRFKDLSQAREDLKKLKKAKAKAEKALKDLKAAQEQLVQQEKLASLGQLTAGIAHEIKNPLNFVNNFSDLSRELIEEAFEELDNVEESGAKDEIIAILTDVRSNLTKVHEHGSRADSIVTSMLQHSRATGSKWEAKAFNHLVKEFVNLSFHGMRAGKSPINVDIDLQLDPAVGEVSLISEDFSRVILNLCNNAFDAMREKLKVEGSDKYLPKLTAKSSLQKEKVLFSIADNGSGIPEEIKNKILQPFFTTKKGTEGTGLGLSITHDIIKAHGGELKVESKEEMGTEFKIFLPLIPANH